MAQESQLAHRVLTNLALPYITNVSPSSTDPHYISGSTDILTSINGYAERRPGFATNVETTPTAFNNLQRLFTWDRFDGTFFTMACDISATGQAVVYKLQNGVDASFVSIFTEVTPTNTPYDFVTSNNTLYFSNGIYVRKWDPVNGVTTWGLPVYSATAGVTSNYAGTGTSVPFATSVWNNPTNAQGAPNSTYATTSPSARTFPGSNSDYLSLVNYGFSLPATSTILGIQFNATAHYTISGGATGVATLYCKLLQNGVLVGQARSNGVPINTDSVLSFGGPTDLWNTTWSGSLVNNSPTTAFGVYVYANFYLTSGTANPTIFVDGGQISISSSGGPIVTFSGTGLTAATGYQYVICYGNSNAGHVGSPSPVSNLVKPTNQGMSIPVVASTDAQVNQIRIFRTTDSATGLGGQGYFEIPNSPVPNTTNAGILDNAADINLNIGSIAPTTTFNDPPTPMQGLVYFAGRIWGFTGNKVWFTGLEEITIGVPEESMPSGIAGNFWSFDQPVQGLGVAGIGQNQTLGILCGGRLYGIQGNTLDTFRRFTVSQRRGARNRTCVTTLGGMMAWLDSANQVWATDGNALNELTPMIRNDLAGITQANCTLTFHTAGRFHWLVLSTGTKLYVYDVDQDQWMPPWTVAAKYIFSGETSPGNYVLMASTGTKAVQLSTTAYNDNGATYAPVARLGLLSVVPDYGSRFSYIGMGSYNEPTRTGYPATFQVTNNGTTLGDFLICSDEDPTAATYTSIASNLVDTSMAFNRSNGTAMKQLVYQVLQPAARWIGMQVNLANADQVDKIYELFCAYKSLGGR